MLGIQILVVGSDARPPTIIPSGYARGPIPATRSVALSLCEAVSGERPWDQSPVRRAWRVIRVSLLLIVGVVGILRSTACLAVNAKAVIPSDCRLSEIGSLNAPHGFIDVAIKLLMQPFQEVRRRRFG